MPLVGSPFTYFAYCSARGLMGSLKLCEVAYDVVGEWDVGNTAG